MDLGVVATGTGVTTFTLQYVPQFLAYTFTSGQFTSISVEVSGAGTLMNLDSNGLSSMGNSMRIGNVTDGIVLPLANGLIPNKNCVIKVTNSGAQTPNLYGWSEQKGDSYIKHYNLTVNRYSGTTIRDFLLAGFVGSDATDIFNIVYSDGTTEQVSQAELRYIHSMLQYVENATSDFTLNNMTRYIQQIQYLPQAADVTINVAQLQRVKGAILNTPVGG